MCHPKVSSIIQTLKVNVDFLFLIVHAGVEYMDIPIPEIRNLYKSYIDLGADAIIASHPHVPQGYEEYKAMHLDPVANAKLIEQSDFVHYEIMSPDGEHYYSKGFKIKSIKGVNAGCLAKKTSLIVIFIRNNIYKFFMSIISHSFIFVHVIIPY